MNLVATSDFRNTNPDLIEVDGALHANHIHKGARLTIGGEAKIDKLTAAQKRVVAALNAAGRVVDEDEQPAKVKEIDAEIAADKASAERQKAKDAASAKK